MYFVYVLKSKKDASKLYYGYTGNLEERFRDHQSGKEPYTRKYRPWILVYYEAYKSKEDAQCREKKLKMYGKGLIAPSVAILYLFLAFVNCLLWIAVGGQL